MDGKGREGTYNFFSRRLGEGSRGDRAYGTGGIGLPATPLAPPMLVIMKFLGHPVWVHF